MTYKISTLLFTTIFVLSSAGCSAAPRPNNEKSAGDSVNIKQDLYPKYSENIEVCGVRLRLEDSEIRERFEREFYNTLHNENVNKMTVNAANWMIPIFKRILAEEGVPEDLMYLAFAESDLRFSVSAAGAAGLWQLMEIIGKSENLKMNYWVDERHHIEKSTRASMRYLKSMYKKYKDWNMVIAAYNVGETNINDNRRFQNVDNFFDLYLNEQTSRYVFRIYAMKEIFQNPTKYGLPAYKIADREVDTLTIKGSVENLALTAQKNGFTYRELRILNPWIKRKGLPDGEWKILIPKKRDPKKFDTSNYNYKVDDLDGFNSREIAYTVAEGDNIFSVCSRYDIEVPDLMRWNKLNSQLLQPGQRLKIMLW